MKPAWKTKKLCDFLTLEYGKPLDKSLRNSKGKYPVYGANGIKDRSDEYYYDKKTIIVGRKGSAGELTLTEDRFWPLDVTYFLKFDPQKYDLRFLYNLLSCLNLPNLATGVKPGINRNNIYQISVSIPDITEQKQIVSILDKTFAAIDKAKANAEQNLKNAKELFESYLQGIFEDKGNDWDEHILKDIVDVEYGYTAKATEDGYFRYIRITDIDKDGRLILADKKYIKRSKEAKKFLAEDKDLLMARTGATFAKVLLFNGDEPSVFASYLIRIKFKVQIENELYWYFTKTRKYWDQANSLQSGSAQPHFNGEAVKKVVFAYPKSVDVQKQLIAKFQALSSKVQKLEVIYQKKISEFEELKKSILQKAFSGELTSARTEVALE